MKIIFIFIIIIIFINLAAYAAYGMDKRKARQGQRRISEKRLLLLAVFGGAIGAFAGMRIHHHKTQKWRFRILVPLCMTLQILLYVGFMACVVYVSDYYHADTKAMSSMQADSLVHIEDTETGTLFDGPGEETAIIFYPGAKVEETAYAPLLYQIAAGGTDCFLVDMPFHLAFFGKDKAQKIINDNHYSYEHWYLAGHSLGGAMAGSFAAGHLEEIDGIIFLASYPVEDLKGDGFGMLSVYGTNDKVLNMENYQDNQIHWPKESVEHVIDGGNHAGFGNYGKQKGDGEAEISAEEQQKETVEQIEAFLNR